MVNKLAESSLKRFLKRKVKVTLGLVVAFLITGSIGYAEDLGTISSNTELTEDSTATGISLSGKDVHIQGDFSLTIDKEGKEGTPIKFSGNKNNLIVDGKIIIKNSKGFAIDSGMSNSPGSMNLIGGVDISNSAFGEEGIRLQGTEFKAGFVNIENSSAVVGAYTDLDNIGTQPGVISAFVNSEVIIGNDKDTGGISIKNITYNDTTSNFKEKMGAGILLYGSSLDAGGNIYIENISSEANAALYGIQSLNFYTSNYKEGVSFVKADNIAIKGIHGNGRETAGISLQGAPLTASSEDFKNSVFIDDVTSSVKNASVYGIVSTNRTENASIDIDGNLNITNIKAENGNAYGMHLSGYDDSGNIIGNTATIDGVTNISVTGATERDENLNLNEAQIAAAKENLAAGNNTISKIFTDLNGEETGHITQGVRANNSTATFEDSLRIESSDIAMTAIGEKAEINVNNGGYFTGNTYIIEDASVFGDNTHLIARPVVQALDGGIINLNGDTFIKSMTSEDSIEDNITNVGIYAQGHTDLTEGSEDFGPDSEINLNGNLTVESDIAIMATASGKVYINNNNTTNEPTNVSIMGDIVAGKHDSEIEVSGDDVRVTGEVVAANGGKITLNLNSENSVFTGRADDYFDLSTGDDNTLDTDFRNDKLALDVSNTGEVTINMNNNARWNVEGQSYVTNLNFGENGGTISLDYSSEENLGGVSLSIETIDGEGTFEMVLNPDDKTQGNMLYIYDASNNGLEQKVNLVGTSVLNLEEGEKLRFATLGKEATEKGVTFTVEKVYEEGINDVNFDVGNEEYDLADPENNIYNGDDITVYKPGDDIIDETYKDGENWYLTRGAGEVNDIGQTIIEMSKANYASAVYMDNLNKRLGDMRFADGKDGFWVRVRNDRVGEDNEYRLINYMTQLGYDKVRPIDNGTGHRGVAFEYTVGDMDYKNINGTADIDRKVFTYYSTRMYNSGFYSDYVFRLGRIDSEFDITGRKTGNRVTGDYDNMFFGASAEYGYRKDLSENWYFEPQVQLQYTYIEDTDYTTNQETDVELSDINSVIGRAGFRLGYDVYSEDKRTATFYVKADINHEFSGDQDVTAKDKTGTLSETYKNDQTWYDLGVGMAKDLNEDLNVYADIERQLGKTKDSNSWQFNLGFRYKF